MSNDVTAWSYSRLSKYEECPAAFKYQFIDKLVSYDDPRMQSPQAQRGDRIHKAAEALLTGVGDPSALAEAKKINDFEAVFKQLVEARPLVEQEWGFRENMTATGWFSRDVWYRSKLDVLVLWPDHTASVVDWKGLALDTALPTPAGWTTMRDVQVGDELFDRDGRVARVVGKSQISYRPCYRITFDDAHSVVCDEVHIWPLERGNVPVTEVVRGDVVCVARPVELPEAEYPVHPYVLGAWLGDGKHTDGSITKGDACLFDLIAACGEEVLPPQKCALGKAPARTVRRLRGRLNQLGVLGNKHVPQSYMRGSVEQRLALLRGLMDTDGNWNKARGQANFTSCDIDLGRAVLQLACSLGERATMHTVTARGFGLTVTAFVVNWSPRRFNPFNLPRKRDQVRFKKPRGRIVRSVERVETVPTQCIAVDSPTQTFLYGDRWAVTHNTGKPWGTNEEQMEQYAWAVFSRYPELQRVEVSLMYLDTGQEQPSEFKRSDLAALENKWRARAAAMFLDTQFAPRPSGQCKRCFFAKSQGGPCAFG